MASWPGRCRRHRGAGYGHGRSSFRADATWYVLCSVASMNLVTILLDGHRSARLLHLRHRVVFWTAVLGLAFASMVLASAMMFRSICDGGDRLGSAAEAVQMLASYTRDFWAIHGRCPVGTDELYAHGLLHRRTQDPWGRAYVVACSSDGETVRVCSRGQRGLAPICSDDDEPAFRRLSRVRRTGAWSSDGSRKVSTDGGYPVTAGLIPAKWPPQEGRGGPRLAPDARPRDPPEWTEIGTILV